MTGVTVGTLDDIPLGEGRAFAVDGAQEIRQSPFVQGVY